MGAPAALAVVLILFGRPAWHPTKAVLADRPDRRPIQPGCSDDASRLEADRPNKRG